MLHVALFSEIKVDEIPLLRLGGQSMILVAQHLVHNSNSYNNQVDVILRVLVGILIVVLGEEFVKLLQFLLLRAHYHHQEFQRAKVFSITFFDEGLGEVGLGIQVGLD
jgi:hypothetical protein